MRLFDKNTDTLSLDLSEAELRVLRACLTNSFAYLHEKDFPLLIGAQKEEVIRIASELNELMRRHDILE